MKPSTAIGRNRDELRSLIARYPTVNPRLFGSTLLGQDRNGSDLDLLFDALPGAALFDLGGLQEDWEALPGARRLAYTPTRPLPQSATHHRCSNASFVTTDRLSDYAAHIRNAATDACAFVRNQAKEAFVKDERTQRVVVMDLVIIGDAATKTMDLDPAFAAQQAGHVMRLA